jgi:hypothetical protein
MATSSMATSPMATCVSLATCRGKREEATDTDIVPERNHRLS